MRKVWVAGFVLAFILLFASFAFALVEKAVVKSIDFEKDGLETLVRITVELSSDGSGEAYLEAIANYDGKDYTTQPLPMSCSLPQQTFTFLLRKSDFHLVNLTENVNQELPEFVEEKNVVVYVYGKKITSPEELQTEDVKGEISRRGYALREVLAKGTKTLAWGKKSQ
ncbi:MAG: hypothetical protein N2Z84_01910 [Atribacterota bacterium]|nr:hypothetical protein [Atribacterota bacterium]